MTKHPFSVLIAGNAQPGMEDYVRDNLLKMMRHSQKDEGCLAYNIHESIEHPGEFMVYMLWADQEAFNKHNEKPEMQEFKHKLADKWFVKQSPKTYWQLL